MVRSLATPKGQPEYASYEETLLIGRQTDYMDGTISRGLKLAAHLLSINDHEALVDTMERRLTHFYNNDTSMRCAIGRLGQFNRRDESPSLTSDKDMAEQNGDAIWFTGDTVPPDGPPFAWVAL